MLNFKSIILNLTNYFKLLLERLFPIFFSILSLWGGKSNYCFNTFQIYFNVFLNNFLNRNQLLKKGHQIHLHF